VLEPIKPGGNPIAELKLALRSVFVEGQFEKAHSSLHSPPSPQFWGVLILKVLQGWEAQILKVPQNWGI
jgi:hypothetical protein